MNTITNLEYATAGKNIIIDHIDDIIRIENNSGLPLIWTKENYLQEQNLKWQLSQLAFLDGKLIGFAFLSQKTELNCHIHRFIIDKNYRKYQFGSLLLQNLKERMFEKYQYMTLFVDNSNISAINFYQKNNFKHILTIEKNFLMILTN